MPRKKRQSNLRGFQRVQAQYERMVDLGLEALEGGLAELLELDDKTIQGFSIRNKGDEWMVIVSVDGADGKEVGFGSGSSPLTCVGNIYERWGRDGVELKKDKFAD